MEVGTLAGFSFTIDRLSLLTCQSYCSSIFLVLTTASCHWIPSFSRQSFVIDLKPYLPIAATATTFLAEQDNRTEGKMASHVGILTKSAGNTGNKMSLQDYLKRRDVRREEAEKVGRRLPCAIAFRSVSLICGQAYVNGKRKLKDEEHMMPGPCNKKRRVEFVVENPKRHVST